MLPGELNLPELEPVVTGGHPVVSIDPDAARQDRLPRVRADPSGPTGDTETTSYPLGEEAFVAMLEALENAKRWIAMEHFIVSDGKMWRALFEVLSRKAGEGVQVWFMYDDLGSLWHLPGNFAKDLKRAGVRVNRSTSWAPG